ncbi:hypothetical protein SDC9_92390 [bioreactor metagenome]|uniref:Uncharacterized protein n=1 Tax=bioreactor metagenome TaxID=1076179 RepID=A0A644ZXL2_9ZZZZ
MCLVDHDQIERAEFTRLVIDALNPGDDYLFAGVTGLQSHRKNADPQFRTEFPDLVGVLFQKFPDVGDDQDPSVPSFNRVLCDLSQADSLAAAGRNYHARIRVLCPQVLIHGGDGFLLIGPQQKAHGIFSPAFPERIYCFGGGMDIISSSRTKHLPPSTGSPISSRIRLI